MPITRLLDRYVLREIVPPFLLGLTVFTFILLMNVLFDAAELIIRRDVPGGLVGQLLLLSLPHIIVVTIPMAFLFAILIAVGRLSADSELVAMRASGISLFKLYRPIMFLAVSLAVLNSYLMLYVMPNGNHAKTQLVNTISARGAAQAIEPGVFFEEIEQKILYVWEDPPHDERWRGIFVTDDLPGEMHEILIAEYGQVLYEEGDPDVRLQLQNSVQIEVDQALPERSNLRQHRSLNLQLADGFQDAIASRSESKKRVRSQTLPELLRFEADPKLPEQFREREQRRADAELHKRFAIPAACLVFGLFGVPLGFNNRRGGRSSGFAVSIAIILVYNILLNNAEEAAVTGRLPALGMWIPNVLFTILGGFLLARKNADKSLMIASLDRWIREKLWRRLRAFGLVRERRQRERKARRVERQVTMRSRSNFVLRLERPSLVFPNTFDRYILRLFARVFLVVLGAGISVYIIANFADLVDDVLENDIPVSTVIDYYQYMSLQIFYQIAPIVVLLTTLIAFGILSRNNEITAAKALGMSLFRLSVPVVLCALTVAGFCVVLESSVLPSSNARVTELKNEIKGRANVRQLRRADRNWLMSDDANTIYNYQYYDPAREELQRLTVYQFDEAHRLRGLLFASNARFLDGAWTVEGGWARRFGKTVAYTPLPGPRRVDIPEQPPFFETEEKSPEVMSYTELAEYVSALRRSGRDVPHLEVQLYNKVALPFVCLVMALVGLPFAFRLGRQGALYGIGLSIGLGMIFYAIIAFFTTLGEVGALPPMVAVWSPNLLFGSLSLYLFLGVRS
ncbi:MAG: LPS export ABC transporter permease LptF [Acidobacteriota bacterium]